MLIGLSSQVTAADSAAIERLKQFNEQKDAIYAHMKRYGINREDVAAKRRLYETSPPYSYPHVKIFAEKLLNPGEHLRIEMDEFVLTLKIPDAPWAGFGLWPYNNTRTPDPAMEKFLKQSNGILDVADLCWYMCRSIFTPGLFGRCETAGVSMNYRVLTPKEVEDISTPEKMRKVFSEFQKSQIPTQEDIERSIREHLIDNRRGNRIVLTPEPVVINGRVWIRYASNRYNGRHYQYVTLLGADRRLIVNFGMPQYDYNANPDPATYPAAIRKGFALMEEMLVSLRIAKINDDGAPDPFVVERVEPAPLPVREKLDTP